MELQPKTRDEIQSIVRSAVEDAVDFVESEISDDRIKAQRYYDGQSDLGFEEGRSKCVNTVVRDKIRAIKPSLVRVFLSTDKPVEFVPRGQEDIAMAEQATDFINHELNNLGFFQIFNDLTTDALVKKCGISKVYYEDYAEAEIYTLTDLSDDEYTLLEDEDDVEILEHTIEQTLSMDQFGMQVETPIHSVKLSRQEMKGKICLESVPPEEFFIDKNARSFDDFYVVAHRGEMTAGELIAQGYDPDDVLDLDGFEGSSGQSEEENFTRTGYSRDKSNETPKDPALKKVSVTEAYMKLDADGVGVPVLHKFILGGTGYELLDYMPCDELPFSKFEIDPEPHTFFGHSLAEIIMDDQDASTAVLRGILDNVSMTNNPRLGIVEGAVNIDDVLNNEIGAVVRMRSPGAVQELTVPFAAGQTLGALEYLNNMVEQKTGVSQGVALNPDAMQSMTRTAVQATVEAAQGQVEMYMRNLAEGMRDLFGKMLRLMNKNFDEAKIVRLNGAFTAVDPRVWNTSMDTTINVGLGTGRERERMEALQQTLQIQQQVYQSYGSANGLVSLTNIRNTLADVLAINGVRNSDRYFAPMTQEIEQQMLAMQQQQQAQMAQGQQDPTQAILQAESMKTQAKMQGDMAKLQLEAQKAAAKDDLERDRMAQDLLTDAARIYGEYGTKVDVARVQAEQDKVRQIVGLAAGSPQ